MRVGVAIVAYNRLECLQRCLHSIFRSESLSRIDSLAVFDDGSSYDLSAEIDFPESLCAKVFQSAANHGVIVNKNRALYYFAEIDPVDIVIILEDDVVVSDGDWLSSWVQSVEIHGHMNYSPGYFRIPEYKKFWLRPDSKGTPQDPFSYSVVTGQCTALHAELIRSKVGYLNPQFQGYGHGHVEWASRLVRLGGDCYVFSMLAMGLIHVVFEKELKPYDIQALIPIIEGAGGVITTIDGGNPSLGGSVVATANPELHEDVLRRLT